MVDTQQLHVQYLTDEGSRKVGVVLSVEEFAELMEDVNDLAAAAERREEPSLTHEQVLEELRHNGIMSD